MIALHNREHLNFHKSQDFEMVEVNMEDGEEIVKIETNIDDPLKTDLPANLEMQENIDEIKLQPEIIIKNCEYVNNNFFGSPTYSTVCRQVKTYPKHKKFNTVQRNSLENGKGKLILYKRKRENLFKSNIRSAMKNILSKDNKRHQN